MISQLLSLISQIGADANDDDDVRRQKFIIVASTLGGIVVQLSVGAVEGFYGAALASLETLILATIMAMSLLIFGVTRRYVHIVAFVGTLIALVSGPLNAILLGYSVLQSSPLIWGFLAPMLTMVIYSPRRAAWWLGAFFVLVIATAIFQPSLRFSSTLPMEAQISIAIVLNSIILPLFIFLSLSYFISQRDIAFRLLRGEQEKSENLLLNILPKEIAAILKNENRVIADHFEGASILFADVVNFTPMSATMKPVELVELLNEVFSHFDSLIEKYGLEKIKTIGDCYMVASGVPRPRPDHAQVLTRMALEMKSFVENREFHGRKITFRIGINSGAVVAGVIGRKKFIYDLWGDAVNTASRMESHGSSGVIQITRATHDLIKDHFVCEPRGTVNVKGKGEMDVWSVQGAKA